MSLKIRLARGGAKKKPFYSIVVADSRSPRDGKFIEKVGTYNPVLPSTDEKRVVLKTERITEWLAKGALPTDRVSRFLDEAGIMTREKRNNPEKSVPRKERKARAEEAAKAAAEAKAAAAAAKAAAAAT